MSIEEEAAILAPFKARAEKGELVEISEIETAYEMRISDWSSDVCSSDLPLTACWMDGFFPGSAVWRYCSDGRT